MRLAVRFDAIRSGKKAANKGRKNKQRRPTCDRLFARASLTSVQVAQLRTARLLLRQWRRDDLKPFADLNADQEVMRYFPAPLGRGESDGLASTAHALIEARGWGLWAVEVVETRLFIGFIGLAEPRFEAHFSPAVEVGWRLARSQWGRGYATEGARAALAYAFDELSLKEVVSFTSAINLRSRRVMERLGMTHEPRDDFDHPLVDDPVLRRHVLYRIRRRADQRG